MTPTEGVLRYRITDSPIGHLGLVASPVGLTDIMFNPKADIAALREETVVKKARPKKQVRQDPSAPELHLEQGQRELEDYFQGSLRNFSVILDVNPLYRGGKRIERNETSFRTTAQLLMRQIPYGQTMSYGQLAELAGSPRAARAIGTACSSNRLPIILPCHRVTRSDGSLGGYGGGVAIKKYLLKLERATQTNG